MGVVAWYRICLTKTRQAWSLPSAAFSPIDLHIYTMELEPAILRNPYLALITALESPGIGFFTLDAFTDTSETQN